MFRQELEKQLLRKDGWNVDVPALLLIIVKDLNVRKGRPKKKHLTGNAYYAQKAGKEMKKRNLYYSGNGSLKGGRPRIYNVV